MLTEHRAALGWAALLAADAAYGLGILGAIRAGWSSCVFARLEQIQRVCFREGSKLYNPGPSGRQDESHLKTQQKPSGEGAALLDARPNDCH